MSPCNHTWRAVFAGGSQGFDTDDGSSFYHIHDNVMYAADGMKMDYGGHDSDFYSNLVVTNPYGVSVSNQTQTSFDNSRTIDLKNSSFAICMQMAKIASSECENTLTSYG